jgi:hypothetical protein
MYKIPMTNDPRPFSQIAMDLITDLPKSHGFDSILTIVDYGTSRVALFLPCNKTITGAGIAKLYYEHVYRWFGTPTRMISDRDPRFTLHFGQALTKQLDIKRNLSTAFHPQTDGLSEPTNQWVEQYLHLITAHDQKNWSQWLPLATAVHNNKRNMSLGFIPNKVLWGQSANLIPNTTKLTPNQMVEERITDLQKWHKLATDAINQAAQSKATVTPTFEEGDTVWLEAKNLRLPHGSVKLAPRHYGPFKVECIINPVAFKICLPPSWNVHPVFHTSLLTPIKENSVYGPMYT